RLLARIAHLVRTGPGHRVANEIVVGLHRGLVFGEREARNAEQCDHDERAFHHEPTIGGPDPDVLTICRASYGPPTVPRLFRPPPRWRCRGGPGALRRVSPTADGKV